MRSFRKQNEKIGLSQLNQPKDTRLRMVSPPRRATQDGLQLTNQAIQSNQCPDVDQSSFEPKGPSKDLPARAAKYVRADESIPIEVEMSP